MDHPFGTAERDTHSSIPSRSRARSVAQVLAEEARQLSNLTLAATLDAEEQQSEWCAARLAKMLDALGIAPELS